MNNQGIRAIEELVKKRGVSVIRPGQRQFLTTLQATLAPLPPRCPPAYVLILTYEASLYASVIADPACESGLLAHFSQILPHCCPPAPPACVDSYI